jgi:hypothetical protein
MIERLALYLFSQLSEKVILELFMAIIKELSLNRKLDNLSAAVKALETEKKELDKRDISNDEKNTILSSRGRDIITCLRK